MERVVSKERKTGFEPATPTLDQGRALPTEKNHTISILVKETILDGIKNNEFS